jgi:hypothetical protein
VNQPMNCTFWSYEIEIEKTCLFFRKPWIWELWLAMTQWLLCICLYRCFVMFPKFPKMGGYPKTMGFNIKTV